MRKYQVSYIKRQKIKLIGKGLVNMFYSSLAKSLIVFSSKPPVVKILGGFEIGRNMYKEQSLKPGLVYFCCVT